MIIIHLKILFALLRFSLILFVARFSPYKNLLVEDIARWDKEIQIPYRSVYLKLVWLLLFMKSFRNIFYLRCPNVFNILRYVCKPDNTLLLAEYNDDNNVTGGSLFFVHAFSTIIRAKYIGEGCVFRQLTTIGTKSTNSPLDAPYIGNNVDFGANVTVIGNIHIGDNVIIGAGAVVVKDIPSNSIVAGNPARIIGNIKK